jgi:signal transduction histidine kinase
VQVPIAQLRSVGTAFLRLRPWIVAPGMMITIACVVLSGAPRAQVVALSIGMTLMLGFFMWEAVRARRAMFDERYLFRSLVITLFGITVACVVTGAVRSPLVPFVFAPTVVAFAAFGRTRRSSAMFVMLLVAVAWLAAMPRGVPFPELARPYDVAIGVTALILAATLLRVGVAGLTDAYGRAATDLEVAREAVLVGAEARTRALEGLGAKVAHEIKNPLASVRGLVELSVETAEGRGKQRLEVALAEVDRIEGILREYLSFSRPLEELRRAPVDLRALANDLRAIVEGRAERAGVAIELAGDSAVINGDVARLKEALLNLVGNAIEATPRGGVVRIEIAPDALTIRDSGRGIAPQDLARVGTPGFTTRAEGTGLGVALARAAIAQHGGTLSFASEQGRGTIVTVRLPQREV